MDVLWMILAASVFANISQFMFALKDHRTEPQRFAIPVTELPRLVSDLQYDSLTYSSGIGVELNRLFDDEGRIDNEWIGVVLSGWQVKKLEARIPKRTLQHEYQKESS